jgi:multimeric flavodoxin WrbA
MVESACHALDSGCDVELIHTRDLTLAFCDGCLSCDKTSACHIDDSMTAVISSMLAADGLIIGTPVRWALLSGELKVLFDRLNPLAVPQKLKGKKAIVFAVGQSTQEQDDSVKLACDSVITFCNSAGIDVVSTVLSFGCLEPNDLIEKSPEVLNNCKLAARKLLDSLSQ